MYDPHYYWEQLSDSQKVHINTYAKFLLHKRAIAGGGILFVAGIILVLIV